MSYKDWQKGDIISLHGRKGTLLSKPVYRTNPRSGLFYADVYWEGGHIQKNFMICRVGLVKTVKASEEGRQTRREYNE
mgnify:CR=1 FL=1